MKKILLLATLYCSVLNLSAQNPFLGKWKGTMNAGQVKLELIFKINETSENNYSVSMDIPAQGAKGIKSSKVIIDKTKIEISFDQMKASYSGTLAPDQQLMDGVWKQSGQEFEMELERIIGDYLPPKKNRPQTPQGPFPYHSEEVNYSGASTKISYGATLTYPKQGTAFTCVVLISGSGAQNRNSEIFEHQFFAVIADYFTRNGIAVLRVDDRGVGQTTGDRSISTSKDFAEDVVESINYLKGLKQIDPKKIGLIGHSEGGFIAQIVASEHKDIAFVISMAGPAMKILDMMLEQNREIFKQRNLDPKVIETYLKLYKALANEVIRAKPNADVKTACAKLLRKWVQTTDSTSVLQMTNITNSLTEENFLNMMLAQFQSPWMKFFMAADPAQYISKISCPVLALNGGKDFQVVPKQNLEAYKKILTKSKNKQFMIKEFEGMNHLFQHCTTCTLEEYDTNETTIEPEVLQFMTDWMKGL